MPELKYEQHHCIKCNKKVTATPMRMITGTLHLDPDGFVIDALVLCSWDCGIQHIKDIQNASDNQYNSNEHETNNPPASTQNA